MSIGEKIKSLREDNGLSQKELAEAAEVSRPCIAQYERGTKIPNMVHGKLIAKTLGCTLDELAEGV